MKIIISPAKRMNEQNDFFPPEALPEFLEKSRVLLAAMKSLTYEEAKQVWQCNEKLAKLNYQRIQEMNLGAERNPFCIHAGSDGLRGNPIPVYVPHDL